MFLARRFLMLRKANEVIGVRQYYEYGELGIKLSFIELYYFDERIFDE